MDEPEQAFRQWQSRAEEGYEEAGETMETVILLLKDEHVRDTLMSLPQRFLEAAPTDSLVELAATQGTQVGIDAAAVFGATAAGAAFTGPGAAFTGGTALAATTGRKAAKVTEAAADMIVETAKEVKKLRNKRTERVKENSHQSQTPGQGNKKDHKPKKCAWKTCRTQHKKPPHYPNTGKTSRNNTYTSDWIKAGLEPWDLYGKGEDISHLPDEAWTLGFGESLSAKTLDKINTSRESAGRGGKTYPTEKHHVISVNLFSRFKELSGNIKLIGWDINGKENGICLPYLAADILRHDLQVHRGQHPKDYNKNLRAELKEIQKQSLTYCKDNRQNQLIRKLNGLAEDTIGYIQNWHPDYLLRKDARKIKQDVEKYKKE